MGKSGPVGEPLKDAILIAGPTASGKSAYASKIAERSGGTIVNADSMQVYSILRVITARPDEAETRRAPHLLYGHVHPSRPYSTGGWLREVSALIDRGALVAPVIFVGGTGLYFKALLGGLSDIPEVDGEIRAGWRARLVAEGPESLHAEQSLRDPKGASSLRPTDGQRISRALEVIDSSGKPLRYWTSRPTVPAVDPDSAQRIVLDVDRDTLRERIARRFDAMIDNGALDEVKQLLSLRVDPALPAMKAIGVPELRDYLSGQLMSGEAVARAKIATMQYAKRQRTWFRNQFGPEWVRRAN